MEEEIAAMLVTSQMIEDESKRLTEHLTALPKSSISMTINVGKSVIVLEKSISILKGAYDRYYEQFCKENSLPSAEEDQEMLNNIYKTTGH